MKMPVQNHYVPCIVHLYFFVMTFISYLLLCVGPNPCAENNGGCGHLCLLSAVAADDYTCTCPRGLVLDVNGKNCSGTYVHVDLE